MQQLEGSPRTDLPMTSLCMQERLMQQLEGSNAIVDILRRELAHADANACQAVASTAHDAEAFGGRIAHLDPQCMHMSST